MKEEEIYKVKWRDSYSVNGWHEDNETADLEADDIITSIGFFLRESKLYWFMYQSITSAGLIAEKLAIPKVSIISKEKIK